MRPFLDRISESLKNVYYPCETERQVNIGTYKQALYASLSFRLRSFYSEELSTVENFCKSYFSFIFDNIYMTTWQRIT